LSQLRPEPSVTEAIPAAIGGANTAISEVPDLQPAAKVATESLAPAWLDEQHERSWWGLASLWQDDAGGQSMQAACEGEVGTGYACLRDQGSWARVKRLGLPVILVLHDRGERHVLLRGLDEQRLLLGVGDAPLPIDRAVIEPLWLGEYIVAWPQDPDWPLEIRRDESGAALDIVMKMARAVDPPWTGGDVFDAGFESWLIAFQSQHGLTADGIIGPKTLLYLMAPSITEPRLFDRAEARR
jgi:general secretion pathway protein A